MAQRIQKRRGTAAAWTAANPILASGEPGYETDTGRVKIGDGTTAWTSLAHFGRPLLAVTQYNPGTQTDLTTASTTDVDADATNLAVTFITPPSGSVLVHLFALGEQPTNSGAVWWTLREGTTTIARRYVTTARVANYDYPGNAAFLITGLTPGSSHTYKWGHYIAVAGSSKIRTGGTLGPAVMEVIAA